MTVISKTKGVLGKNSHGAMSVWLSVDDIASAVSGKRSTVARALRKLRSQGDVSAQIIPGDRYRRKQWSKNGNGQGSVTYVPQQRTKGFAQGRTKMCTPADKPTLVKATTDVVKELMATEESFSAYDVTKKLRELSNFSKVIIDKDETGSVHVSGTEVPKIDHEVIKGIVHDIHHAGEMDGYDRVHTGAYWEYSKSSDDVVDDDDEDDSDDNQDYDGSPSLG